MAQSNVQHSHVVTRAFPGPQGRTLHAGTRVDASSWTNRRLLEDEGFMRPLTDKERTPPTPTVPPAPPSARKTR